MRTLRVFFPNGIIIRLCIIYLTYFTIVHSSAVEYENHGIAKRSTLLTDNNRCPADTFQCKSGACIPRNFLCNGFRDCVDSDDESYETCKSNKCPADTFQCKSGACIPRNFLCNGFGDCVDFDDESYETCKSNKCPADQFQCKSGACVERSYLCDGFLSCVDWDDDSYETCKNNTCPADQFQCKSGACIPRNFLCNGIQNCVDWDDDSYETCKNNTCTDDMFQCKSGACVSIRYVCNGIGNCVDSDDESDETCKSKKDGAPPQNVTGEAVGPSSISLQWKRPLPVLTKGKITYYKVFKVKATHSDLEADMTKIQGTNIRLDLLKPWTDYRLWVLAGTEVGDGRASPPITIRTQEDASSTPARNVTVRPLDAISVSVHWKKPDSPNGQVIGYNVYYTTNPDIPILLWNSKRVLSNRTSTIITDLTPLATYTIEVQAFTRAGPGPVSAPIIIKTPLGESK